MALRIISARSLVVAVSAVGLALAVVVLVIAVWAGDWTHAFLGAIWLFLVGANFREWLRNDKRRDGFFEREKEMLRTDRVKWTEQLVVAQALVAGRFVDRVKEHGLERDRVALAACGRLFEAIASIELPDGVNAEVRALHAKAREAADSLTLGSMPEDRVLH